MCIATSKELSLADAVAAYPFNCQLIEVSAGKLAIVAPHESEQTEAARRFLERVVAEENPVENVHYVEVNASMKNGGGPACLRLRVLLEEAERACISARVFLDEALYLELRAWVERHYRDRLTLDDLADPAFLVEVESALDQLTELLRLGSVYDFQRA
jgi:succinylarginine dihydrolase